LLKALVVAIPTGFIAIEAGWIVTELGRQPWIIYGIMRTSEGVTPVPGMVYHFCLFLALYGMLTLATVWLLRRLILAAQRKFEG
jgi:cytochrome d ubiquinol oxidase subunit I